MGQRFRWVVCRAKVFEIFSKCCSNPHVAETIAAVGIVERVFVRRSASVAFMWARCGKVCWVTHPWMADIGGGVARHAVLIPRAPCCANRLLSAHDVLADMIVTMLAHLVALNGAIVAQVRNEGKEQRFRVCEREKSGPVAPGCERDRTARSFGHTQVQASGGLVPLLQMLAGFTTERDRLRYQARLLPIGSHRV